MARSTLIVILFFCSCFNPIYLNPIEPKTQPTCQACHSLVEGKINVHLVPHSHDDVGWLKTFSQYYYGTGSFNKYENAGVQYIISSTVEALKANPNRRFIQVETAFFWKWWLNQDNETRQDVVDLVNSGRLEMVNGAWSMNDEAAAHYQSIIDEFTWGFRILDYTVGKCSPKIGWQIDPFGHSREHASIVKQLGFDGLVIGRLDYRDKTRRKKDKSLDFMWKSSDNLNNSELFTTMFPDFYVDEPGFHFDIMYGDSITDSNLNTKVKNFAGILDGYKLYYRTANIMMPMGNDFTYQVAERNFENIDKLIAGFENHEAYNVFYSTPSCYIQAVKKEIEEKSITLEEKTDDFFPYASNANQFWTGYFTSRPTSKRFERTGNNILQSIKQLTTFSRIRGKEYDPHTLDLRQAMGVVQHHDAITGTEKQAVADDYARMLHSGIKTAEEPLSDIILNFLEKESADFTLKFSTCLLANSSICENSQKDRFVVAVQNPLSRTRTSYVRLPVDGISYKVTGPDGEEIYDIFDSIHTFDYIQNEGNVSKKELIFAAKDLPPLGIKLYYIEKINESEEAETVPEASKEDVYLGTEDNGFTIDGSTEQLKSITINNVTQEVTQEFLYYRSSSSGAYIFRPSTSEAIPFFNQSFIKTQVSKGQLVDQYLQIINDEIRQIIRVYKGNNDAYIEFDWLVGDLEKVDTGGVEIITRFTIKDFNNSNIFYTDSNGREQIKRQLNHRNDYEYNAEEEPVASNYYPVTSKIVIKDENKGVEVAVLNDRAQGGTSLSDGTIELMIHRKLSRDDGKGVNEVLNEKQYGHGLYVRGQHFLTFGPSTVENGKSTAAFERILAKEKLLEPLVLIADATDETLTLETLQNSLYFQFQGLNSSLPDNVNILTLEPWIDSYIIRFEHLLEKDEDEELSKPATVILTNLFPMFAITEIKETTLGANEFLEENSEVESSMRVTLNPMQIRTFIFKTDQNNLGGHDNGMDHDSHASNTSNRMTPHLLFTLLILCMFLLK